MGRETKSIQLGDLELKSKEDKEAGGMFSCLVLSRVHTPATEWSAPRVA